MDLIYGVIGVVARRTERLSRIRHNGVPVSWAIWFTVAVLTGVCLFKLAEATRNLGPARRATVAQVLQDRGMLDAHVTVSGDMYTVTARDTGADPIPDRSVFAVVNGGQAMYILTVNSPADREAIKSGQATGMVRTIDKQLKDQLDVTPPMIGDTLVDDRVALMANETPPSPILWIILTILGSAVTIVISAAVFMRYVVFRPQAASPPIEPANDPAEPNPPLRASGIFTFNENPKLRSRFLDMPAVLADMASGDKALVSNIDASVRFMGQVTKKRDGLWSIVIKSDSVCDVEDGLQYTGFKPRPAIRFGFVDAMTGKESEMVVNFDAEADRRAFRAKL
jgi:hypothetical protein